MIIIFQYPLPPVRALTAQPANRGEFNDNFCRLILADVMVQEDLFKPEWALSSSNIR